METESSSRTVHVILMQHSWTQTFLLLYFQHLHHLFSCCSNTVFIYSTVPVAQMWSSFLLKVWPGVGAHLWLHRSFLLLMVGAWWTGHYHQEWVCVWTSLQLQLDGAALHQHHLCVFGGRQRRPKMRWNKKTQGQLSASPSVRLLPRFHQICVQCLKKKFTPETTPSKPEHI